jgi:hypothetical protein
MLAHGSTAQFALSLGQPISRWLDHHASAGFFLGLVLLAVAILWPEIKQHLPALPKSPTDRLKAVEEVNRELEKKLAGLISWIERAQLLERIDKHEIRLNELADHPLNPVDPMGLIIHKATYGKRGAEGIR